MHKKYLFLLYIIFLLFPSKIIANTKQIEQLIFGWQMEDAYKQIKRTDEQSDYIKGLYEFYSGNYKAAREHFNNLPQKDNMWIKILEDTKLVVDDFSQVETKYFIIRYTGKDQIIAQYLETVIDESVDKFFKKLKWKPSEKVILEIYPDRKSFQAASTLTDKHIKVSGAIGICKFNRLMLASPRILKFGYRWMNTAIHEYIHYII